MIQHKTLSMCQSYYSKREYPRNTTVFSRNKNITQFLPSSDSCLTEFQLKFNLSDTRNIYGKKKKKENGAPLQTSLHSVIVIF
jgi:hypothetical protein